MAGWSEIEVEQKIAQERYQVIVQGQQVASINRKRRGLIYHRFLNYLGDKLVTWGYYLKQRYNISVEKPICESR